MLRYNVLKKDGKMMGQKKFKMKVLWFKSNISTTIIINVCEESKCHSCGSSFIDEVEKNNIIEVRAFEES